MSFQPFAPHLVDSYKLGHHVMYTTGLSRLYNNFTPRSDKNFLRSLNTPEARIHYDRKVVVYGVQGVIMELVSYFDQSFFKADKATALKRIKRRVAPFISAMDNDVTHWDKLWDHGRLPLTIRSLDEGTLVDFGVPVFTIHDVAEGFSWLTNYVETWVSSEAWKPMTVATIARIFRRIGLHYAKLTGSDESFVNWQFHGFELRGMSGVVDGAKAGSGHLTSFMGSDNLPAFDWLDYAYEGENTFLGGSVPATEHSVNCMEGPEGEFDHFKRLISEKIPNGMLSMVSDGFDYWNVLKSHLPALKKHILKRGPDSVGLAKVVIRPDSGDPVDIICGTLWDIPDFSKAPYNCESAEQCRDAAESYIMKNKDKINHFNDTHEVKYKYCGRYYSCEVELDWCYLEGSGKVLDDVMAKKQVRFEPTPEELGSIEYLWEIFGGTYTKNNYKVLDPHIGLIYGDSITIDRAATILERLAHKGFASSNVVLGVGSFTYQYLTRDTFGFAIKATYCEINGVPRDIFKDPKTDSGGKRSAKGILSVIDGVLHQGQNLPLDTETDHGELKIRFADGEFRNKTNIEEIRIRLDPTFYPIAP